MKKENRTPSEIKQDESYQNLLRDIVKKVNTKLFINFLFSENYNGNNESITDGFLLRALEGDKDIQNILREDLLFKLEKVNWNKYFSQHSNLQLRDYFNLLKNDPVMEILLKNDIESARSLLIADFIKQGGNAEMINSQMFLQALEEGINKRKKLIYKSEIETQQLSSEEKLLKRQDSNFAADEQQYAVPKIKSKFHRSDILVDQNAHELFTMGYVKNSQELQDLKEKYITRNKADIKNTHDESGSFEIEFEGGKMIF